MNNLHGNIGFVPNEKSNNDNEQVVRILHNIGRKLGVMTEDIQISLDMLSIGNIDTSLTKKIKNTIKDPIKEMYEMGNSMNNIHRSILNTIISRFFSIREDLIERAVSRPKENGLSYYIVLKEDTTENRHVMFSFLRWYDTEKISEILPLSFQFVPKSVQHKLVGNEMKFS